MFRKACQNDEDSVAQYVTRLRQLAHLCEFGDQVDDFIRDQAIDNGRSKRLRTKLLAERDLNLDRVLDLAGAMEASDSQAAQIAEGGERSYMVYGKTKVADPHSEPCSKTENATHNISTQMTAQVVADPHSEPCSKTENANHNISTQMTAQVVLCSIAGLEMSTIFAGRTKMPAPDVAVVDTRRMHVSALKTPSVSNVVRQDISAKCVYPTVRMRSHVHVHACI